MAFPATMVAEVNGAAGSDGNGGFYDSAKVGVAGSLDYTYGPSQQAIAYSDLAIDAATNTLVSSAARPFVAADVGNVLNVTAGTGFTVQRVRIASVAAGKATLDSSAGTLSSTGGTAVLGGALATPTPAAAAAVAQNATWIRGGGQSYSTAPLTLAAAAGGGNTGAPFNRLIGYHAARGDITRESTLAGTTTRPVLTLASGTALVTASNIAWYLANLDLDCASIASSTGVVGNGFSEYHNVRVRNYATAGLSILTNSAAIDCEAAGGTLSTGIGITAGAQSIVSRCSVHDGAGTGINIGGSSTARDNLVANQSGATADGIRYSGECTVAHNTVHNVGRHCVANQATAYTGVVVKENLLSTPGASGDGLLLATGATAAPSLPAYDGNAYFGMALANAIVLGGNVSATGGSIGYTPTHDVLPTVLTVNPFVSSATGDFRLNNLAGGGALLRGLGQAQPGFAATGSGYFGCYAPADAGPGDQFTSTQVQNLAYLLGLDGTVAAPVAGNVPQLQLGAAGLDRIAVTDPGNVSLHTTLSRMIVAIWRHHFKKVDKTPTAMTDRADDGTTANAARVISDDGAGNQTMGAAS